MKSTLQTLNVPGCGVSVASVKDMLKKYGMEGVNVVEEDNSPSAG